MTDKLCDHQLSSDRCTFDDEGNLVCPWCEEVQALKEEIKALKDCIGKTTCTFKAGRHELPGIHTLGYVHAEKGAAVHVGSDITVLGPRGKLQT